MTRSTTIALLAIFAVASCAESDNDATTDDVDTSIDVVDSGAGGAGRDASAAADDADGSDSAESPADDRGDDDDDDAVATIPARFRGEWNADRAACGTGSSETRLRISAGEIRFYESVGVVQDVGVESDRAIAVTAEYMGEGDMWSDERRLTLSADGNSLTVSGGGDLVRYRCP